MDLLLRDSLGNIATKRRCRGKGSGERLQAKATYAWQAAFCPLGKRKGRKPIENKTTHTVEGQVGDSRFLSVALECVEKRMKLLGVGKEEVEKAVVVIQVVEIVVDTREQYLEFNQFRERLNGYPISQPAANFAEAGGVPTQ